MLMMQRVVKFEAYASASLDCNPSLLCSLHPLSDYCVACIYGQLRLLTLVYSEVQTASRDHAR